MKKTLTVNISGIVFHIDEDAYNVLNDYLQSIKQHFAKTEGKEEIVSDIETRIAEMLKETITNGKQVITIEDIDKVIEVIGRPEEFGEPGEENGSYDKTYGARATKRLYRDTDNAILAGVCSGLGAYFQTDPLWFRLAFVILSIPGVGTPILVYLVLWVLVPEARTAAEKLQMKGEKVNISNIEKSIREEIGKLKNKINEFAQGARHTYKKKRTDHRSDIQNIGNALSRIIELFVKIILVFVGIILFIVGLSLIVAFFAGLFGFGHQIFILDSDLIFISFPTLVDLILGEAGSNAFLVMGIVLLLGIPLFMILYGGIRLIFGIERRRYVGRVAINLWLAGLILTGYYGYKIAKSFRQEGITESNITMVVPQDSTIRLSVKSDPDFDRILKFGDYVEVKDMNMILTSKDTGFFYGIPRFEIERYNGSTAELEIIKGARGKSTMDAGNRASQTIYSITRSGDSLLLFDPFFKLPEHDVWRRQQVDLVLKVPEGIKIKFDQNMNSFLNRNYITRKYAGKTWIMTETGLSEIGQ